MGHAVVAFGIARVRAVGSPVGGFHQFLKGFGVTFLQQVAGFLPAEDVVGRATPGGAGQVEIAAEEFEIEW